MDWGKVERFGDGGNEGWTWDGKRDAIILCQPCRPRSPHQAGLQPVKQ